MTPSLHAKLFAIAIAFPEPHYRGAIPEDRSAREARIDTIAFAIDDTAKTPRKRRQSSSSCTGSRSSIRSYMPAAFIPSGRKTMAERSAFLSFTHRVASRSGRCWPVPITLQRNGARRQLSEPFVRPPGRAARRCSTRVRWHVFSRSLRVEAGGVSRRHRAFIGRGNGIA